MAVASLRLHPAWTTKATGRRCLARDTEPARPSWACLEVQGARPSLTNEVQRRAKRVRCNAGLGRAAVTVDCRACSCPTDRDPSPHRESCGLGLAEGRSSEGLGSPGSLLKTPLMVRRVARLVLECGQGLGPWGTPEPAVTHRGRRWTVGEHMATATDAAKGRRDAVRHRPEGPTCLGSPPRLPQRMSGHERDERPERRRTVPVTYSLLGPARPNE